MGCKANNGQIESCSTSFKCRYRIERRLSPTTNCSPTTDTVSGAWGVTTDCSFIFGKGIPNIAYAFEIELIDIGIDFCGVLLRVLAFFVDTCLNAIDRLLLVSPVVHNGIDSTDGARKRGVPIDTVVLLSFSLRCFTPLSYHDHSYHCCDHHFRHHHTEPSPFFPPRHPLS